MTPTTTRSNSVEQSTNLVGRHVFDELSGRVHGRFGRSQESPVEDLVSVNIQRRSASFMFTMPSPRGADRVRHEGDHELRARSRDHDGV